MTQIPISLYIDEELIGSGNLLYSDESKITLFNQSNYVCDETPIVDENGTEIGTVEYCHEDLLSSWIPGTRKVKYDGPVYDDRGEIIGYASFEHEDRYNMSLVVPLAAFLFILLLTRR